MLCVPDQIIDYTWGRDHTLFEKDLSSVTHIDFTDPYCEALRHDILVAADGIGVPVKDGGTYAATQVRVSKPGPRLSAWSATAVTW